MFGNPRWFRPKTIGFGLIPVAWQGWAYAAGWGGTIGLPFWLLVTRHQSLEALVWLSLATGALGYDVWEMWRVLWRARVRPPGAATSVSRIEKEGVGSRLQSMCRQMEH